MHPQINRIKEQMLAQGAIAAMMSGSGPTVFGIFEREEDACAARESIRGSGLAKQVYVTRPASGKPPRGKHNHRRTNQ
jgi:4-diphosphocytidyl-2-C-methyl-D-erythritol kinase